MFVLNFLIQLHFQQYCIHQTAVIAPIKDEDLSTKSKDNRNNQLNDDALKMTKNANNIKRVPYKSYDKVENSCCRSCLRRSCYFCMYPMSKSRCRWAAVLLGITLGALITGLVLGLVLGNQLKGFLFFKHFLSLRKNVLSILNFYYFNIT